MKAGCDAKISNQPWVVRVLEECWRAVSVHARRCIRTCSDRNSAQQGKVGQGLTCHHVTTDPQNPRGQQGVDGDPCAQPATQVYSLNLHNEIFTILEKACKTKAMVLDKIKQRITLFLLLVTSSFLTEQTKPKRRPAGG